MCHLESSLLTLACMVFFGCNYVVALLGSGCLVFMYKLTYQVLYCVCSLLSAVRQSAYTKSSFGGGVCVCVCVCVRVCGVV